LNLNNGSALIQKVLCFPERQGTTEAFLGGSAYSAFVRSPARFRGRSSIQNV